MNVLIAYYWNRKVVILSKLSSLVPLKTVVLTTFSATSGDEVLRKRSSSIERPSFKCKRLIKPAKLR